jgi:hypothetical protein
MHGHSPGSYVALVKSKKMGWRDLIATADLSKLSCPTLVQRCRVADNHIRRVCADGRGELGVRGGGGGLEGD